MNMHKIIFLLFFTLFSCANNGGPVVIDAAETENMLKKDPSVQLIDVRTPSEWQQTGTIEGARRLNFHAPDFETQVARLDKNKPVIVYCAAGSRSPRAAAVLSKLGFKKVFDYSGGMSDWKAQGRKTVP
jgi:rhodanese-related sulfurtransferase